ncbi:MAG: ATP synthase F1 subunit delta [Thiohalospira sp.]
MFHSQINVRYAKSLFLLARDKKLVEEIKNDIGLIYQSLNEIPDILGLLEHPVIKTSRKKAVLIRLFEGKVNQYTLSFLALIVKNKRENHLKGILKYFIDLYREYKGIKTTTITTAIKLSEKEKKDIIDAVGQQFNANVELKEKVDENILGGLIIEIDNQQLDLSVAKYLDNLKTKFLDFEINYLKKYNHLK